MARVNKIDSNIVGLSIAEEARPGVLTAEAEWTPFDPNSFSGFGAQITTISRDPLNPSRQRKKGVVSDLDASGGFNNDLTQTNLQNILQGYLLADARMKPEIELDDIGANSTLTIKNTAKLKEQDILLISGSEEEANNQVVVVTNIADATRVRVRTPDGSPLTVENRMPKTAKVKVVGVTTGGKGTIKVDVKAGDFPRLIFSDPTDMGRLGDLIPGEWISICSEITPAGGCFDNTENNGWKRIRSVDSTTGIIVIDKSDTKMVPETLAVRKGLVIWIGDVYRNELGTLVKRRTYQIERTLGAPDQSKPNEIQAEYVIGATPSEMIINIPQADKVNMDLSFVAMDAQPQLAAVPLKIGKRPALQESSAFNTSQDFKRVSLTIQEDGVATPEPLFGYMTDLTINLNNNVEPLKAVGVLGAFDTSVGTFAVSGSMTSYYVDVNAVKAVRENADVSLDMLLLREKAGILIDMPLITLGDAQANIEKDQAIKLPLTFEAASGAKLDPTLDYTLQFMFFHHIM